MVKRTKKLLSMLTAAAMAASTFAGFAISANAESKVYVDENFDDAAKWGTETIIASAGKGSVAPDPVTKGLFKFEAGNRGNGPINCNAAVNSGALVISSDGFCTSGRGVKFSFTNEAAVPAYSAVDEAEALEMSFDLKSTATFTVDDGFGQITTDDLTTTADTVKARVILDKTTSKQYLVVQKADGTFLNSKVAAETATGITGMTFRDAAGSHTIDNLKVETKAPDVGVVTVKVLDQSEDADPNAVLADAIVKVDDNTATFKTAADGTVDIALPVKDTPYSISVEKIAYEHTSGEKDSDTKEVTVSTAGDKTEEFELSAQVYNQEPTTVTMAGGQLAITAPRTSESVATPAFTVDVLDQNGVEITEGADTVWTVLPKGSEEADSNVTIENGVVTVKNGFSADDAATEGTTEHVKEFTVKAAVTKSGKTGEATKDIKVSDYYFYEPGVDQASYGGTARQLTNSETTITVPNSATTETITLPEEVAFTAGTGKHLTYKTMMDEKGYYSEERNVTFKDAAGKTVIGPITIAGAADTTAQGIGIGWTKGDAAWTAGSPDKWGAAAPDTWMNVDMTFITYNNGSTKVTVKVDDGDEFVYDIAEGVTGIKTIDLKGAAVNRYIALKDIIIDDADVSDIAIGGKDQISSIDGVEREVDYEVLAALIDDGTEFTWTTDIAGATITANEEDSTKAVLKVPGTVTSGGKITVESNEEPKRTAEFQVTIAPAVPEFAVEGPAAIELQDKNTAPKYLAGTVKDQYGDDITEYVHPVWTSSDEDVATINDATGELTVVGKGTTTIAATITNGTIEQKKETTLIVDNFYAIGDVADGAETIEVDLADIAAADKYLVTTATADGTLVKQTEVDAPIAGGTPVTKTVAKEAGIKITATYADGILQTVSKADVAEGAEIDLTSADENTKVFFWTGFDTMKPAQTETKTLAATDSTKITIDTKNAAKYEIVPIFKVTDGLSNINASPATIPVPDATYDVDFEKVTTGRVDMKVNGYIVVENAGMGGNGRGVSDTRTYSACDVVINQGKAVISGDGACELASVTIKKTPEIVTRKTHIWIGGDSTVCVYYGNEETGDVKDMQTGWGQVIDTYLEDSVTVVDLAESGSYVHRWFGEEYPTVRDMAQPGDYFFVQFGINDRSHTDITNEADMKALLGQMIDELRAKGVTPVLITPQKSVGYAWYSGTGDTWEDVSWSSYGFGTGAMQAVATEKGTLFVDNASNSAEAFFNLGRQYVIDNFHLTGEATNNKYMHFSYAGAQKLASMIAQSIYDQQQADTTANEGKESFAGVPIDLNGQFTFTDSNEASQTYKVTAE